MSKKEYKFGKDPGIEWWKKRKYYEGHISEITLNIAGTDKNFIKLLPISQFLI